MHITSKRTLFSNNNLKSIYVFVLISLLPFGDQITELYLNIERMNNL